jgi:cytochrome b561
MDVTEQPPQPKYDSLMKTLHWTWAFTWIAVWCLGMLAVYWRDTLNADDQLTFTHKAIGLSILVLLVARFAWRFVRKPAPLAAPMTDAERAAHIAHQMLYVLALFLLPLSGWIWSSIAGQPMELLWLVKVPPLLAPHPAYYNVAMWVHTGIAWLTGLLIVAHIGAALKRHFIDRDQTLRQMLPGGPN